MPETLNIAICGIRGIPACYGGFETFAEELSTRLVQKGHRVRVYGRSHVIDWKEPKYRGVDIRLLPAPKHKYLETPVHSFLCFLDLLFSRPDVLLVCNAANSPFLWIPKLARIPVGVNVDGIERMRGKWNAVGRLWYRLGEYTSVLFADELIADADVIAEYYRSEHRAESSIIGYGFREPEAPAIEAKLAGKEESVLEHAVYKELGLEVGKYLLFVSRLEPENNAHRVISAYNRLPEAKKVFPLVIVGDAPYAKDYIASLHALAGPKIVFAGYRFADSYEALQLGAYAYIQATEVGGTHPALVEAMGFGNCVIGNGTPENREVLGEAGIIYSKNSEEELSAAMLGVIADRERVIEYRKKARERASGRYSWDNICKEYERLFYKLSTRNRGVSARK